MASFASPGSQLGVLEPWSDRQCGQGKSEKPILCDDVKQSPRDRISTLDQRR
jgi:hypothetical protein